MVSFEIGKEMLCLLGWLALSGGDDGRTRYKRVYVVSIMWCFDRWRFVVLLSSFANEIRFSRKNESFSRSMLFQISFK
jgi:hypothetical protein